LHTLVVNPVIKALAIELVGFEIGAGKFIITGADVFFREPNSSLMIILPAVIAPSVMSGLALAQKPTCTKFHELG
jgi:hypothetical protein